MLEQQIQKQIDVQLTRRGVWVTKIINANRRGVPDLLACVEGHFFAIEVKRPGMKATPIQKAQLARITKAGGTAIVATCWEDVEAHLGNIFNEEKEK